MTGFFSPRLLLISFLSVVVLWMGLAPMAVLAQAQPSLNWRDGPAVVDLGTVAQVDLGSEHTFLDGDDTRKLLKYWGEPISDVEVGTVFPISEDEDWAVYFDYNPIGYVRDDENAALDAKALLESIKEGNSEGNKIRVENGNPPFNIIGWYEAPHYDRESHNLVWATYFQIGDTSESLVNYNVRLLGRGGVISVVLAADLAEFAATKPKLDDVLARFSWKQGKEYTAWVPGDRVAEIGLTALIAGGAGAVAAKVGLLAKIWKVLVAGFVAVAGAVGGLIRRIFGRGKAALPGSEQAVVSGGDQTAEHQDDFPSRQGYNDFRGL